ncbi:SpoIIE family protein phosphatase [Halobacillus kuroshimensis]|uniref:SpoIIE family protein phosphatase n=1 Tax=Halobacillus kuroshimensis TaxID=302481 RepID=A0ABS3E0J5_9BACI|nr:SpoIIE family protein phosphatase [Halobacillus kuroshimensis]
MEKGNERVELSVFQKAKKGNYYCGDSYFYRETDDAFLCALADGLGSGEMARESSKAVMEIIEDHPSLSVEALVKKCNEVLVGKRGVVLGILKIDYRAMSYSYSSIGNIGVITVDPDGTRHRNIPLAGYLSGYSKSLRVTHGNIQKGMIFLMFSDGVNDRRLSSKITHVRNAEEITSLYKNLYGQNRDDDTTLIAMVYH